MKKKLFLSAIISAAMVTFSSCSDSDNEPGGNKGNADLPKVTEGAFVLNQGVLGLQIDGSLTLVDYSTGTSYQNLFKTANDRTLGDCPQTAVVYGSKIYIGVCESNTIEVIDRVTYKSIKQISLASNEGHDPRSLVAKGGKVYASMFNGYVSRIDTLSLTIDKNVQVGPNPEIMAIHGNYLYVPNSDGLNWQNGYGTTASKINLSTMEVEKTFTVGLNPSTFVSNGTDLFLLCKGNYSDVASAVYRIGADDASTYVADATLMAIKDKNLYLINAPYGASEFDYSVIDINSGTSSPMIDDEGVESPAGIGVDPINGNIVITSYSMDNGWTSYTTDGYVKVYDKNGNLLQANGVGVGPCAVFFNYR